MLFSKSNKINELILDENLVFAPFHYLAKVLPARSNILHMRPLREEHNGSTACNDANPRPTLRNRVQRIYLTPPLDAQARSKVQTGLLPGL